MAKRDKAQKLHVYVVFWEARHIESGEMIKGWTEINMKNKWNPGEISGVMSYIINLIGDGYDRQMVTSVLPLGKHRIEKEGEDES